MRGTKIEDEETGETAERITRHDRNSCNVKYILSTSSASVNDHDLRCRETRCDGVSLDISTKSRMPELFVVAVGPLAESHVTIIVQLLALTQS